MQSHLFESQKLHHECGTWPQTDAITSRRASLDDAKRQEKPKSASVKKTPCNRAASRENNKRKEANQVDSGT